MEAGVNGRGVDGLICFGLWVGFWVSVWCSLLGGCGECGELIGLPPGAEVVAEVVGFEVGEGFGGGGEFVDGDVKEPGDREGGEPVVYRFQAEDDVVEEVLSGAVEGGLGWALGGQAGEAFACGGDEFLGLRGVGVHDGRGDAQAGVEQHAAGDGVAGEQPGLEALLFDGSGELGLHEFVGQEGEPGLLEVVQRRGREGEDDVGQVVGD